MAADLKSRLLSLAMIAAAAGLVVAVIATSNGRSPYAEIAPFVGCYSSGADRLMLGPRGEVTVNGTSAGSYKILEPVGGKHGFLVEADGMTLSGGQGTPIRVARGNGGFLWPIDNQMLKVIFAPDVSKAFRRSTDLSC